MARLLFRPLSIVFSLLAGLAARRVFEHIWTLLDDEEPPESGEEDASTKKVVIAAALQSAVFGAVRAAFDRQARRTFRALTGSWPGPKQAS